MKLLAHILLILLCFGLTTCANRSNLYFDGSQHFGKNKVIKKDFEETQNAVENNFHEDALNQPILQSENLRYDRISDSTTTKIIDQLPPIISDNPAVNKVQKKIEEKKKWISSKDKPITFNTDKKSGVQAAEILTTILIILGIIIITGLVVILLTYLIILAIASAANNASEEAGCYIATMAYGSYDHPKVMTLRVFRDEFLAQRKWGQKFIKWYYRNSPSFVAIAKNHKLTNLIIRSFLSLFERFLRLFYKS